MIQVFIIPWTLQSICFVLSHMPTNTHGIFFVESRENRRVLSQIPIEYKGNDISVTQAKGWLLEQNWIVASKVPVCSISVFPPALLQQVCGNRLLLHTCVTGCTVFISLNLSTSFSISDKVGSKLPMLRCFKIDKIYMGIEITWPQRHES